MNNREIKERKKYLALQFFYIKVKELLEEVEKRLNPAPEKSSK